jgi:hypothetical protein
MTKKIKNIVSLFLIGMILQSCGEEIGGVECIRFDLEDFKENWDDSEITTVDGVDDVVIYKYKGEKFTGSICYDFGNIDNTGFSFDDHRKYGKISKVKNKALEEIERSIKYGSIKTPRSGAGSYRAFQARTTYKNGLKNGLEIGWAKYSDDRIDTAHVINWKNGYVDGKCIWYKYSDDHDYDENYNPNPCDTCKAFSLVINFKKGKADGPFFEYGLYDLDGKGVDENFVTVKGNHKNGKTNGALKFYETYRQDDDKSIVYLKSEYRFHKGNGFAKKFFNKDGSFDGLYSEALTINLDSPKEDSMFSYSSNSYEAVPFDTVINGKKYQFGEKEYNRWEYIYGDLIQTRKNGKYSANIKLADTTEIKDWGKLIYIVK